MKIRHMFSIIFVLANVRFLVDAKYTEEEARNLETENIFNGAISSSQNEMTNFALEGKASASCTDRGGSVSRMIDGNTNSNWRSKSIARTCNENGAWLEVNLGSAKNIDRIVIWNRMDCCSNDLSRSIVEIMDSEGNVMAREKIRRATRVPSFSFSFDAVEGSKVRVTSDNGNKPLQIAELQVFGKNNGDDHDDHGSKGRRFSKAYFLNDLDEAVTLTSENYPLSMEDYRMLSTETNAISVVRQRDPEVVYNIRDLINKLGGHPSHPSSHPDDGYWQELETVIDFQLTRREYPHADVGELLPSYPALWEGFDLEDAAEAVHDEFPGYWQEQFIGSLITDGLNIDNDIIPKRSEAQFLHGVVMLADLNTWSIRAVGPNSFGCKWYAGRMRPEETVWLIATGEMTTEDGVPQHIVDKVNSMDLTSAADFTAYPEGSPRHPSWPAMHSAASQASLWLSVVLNLTDEQWKEAKRVDNAVSAARTIAGVHYEDDNTFGLNLGQKVVADQLADYLHDVYGSDKDTVNAKIARMRFTWPVDLD